MAMFAGLRESAGVDTPSPLRASPIAKVRAFGMLPWSYASSGDVDMGCANAGRDATNADPMTMATARLDLRTGATLTARTNIDEFSAGGRFLSDETRCAEGSFTEPVREGRRTVDS